ncbi:20142_t:CDS:1, partial [Racocetra persica]
MNPPTSENLTNLTPNQRCFLLFNVSEPLEIFLLEFDNNWWPLVSNIWTKFSHGNLVNGDSWNIFTCRFAKNKLSSSRKKNVLQEK